MFSFCIFTVHRFPLFISLDNIFVFDVVRLKSVVSIIADILLKLQSTALISSSVTSNITVYIILLFTFSIFELIYFISG